MLGRVSTPWESESSTSIAPASAAIRAFVSLRSRRSGLALISRKGPVRTAASTTRSPLGGCGPEEGAGAARPLHHAPHVELIGLAQLDLAPGGMPDRVHQRVLHRVD